MTLFNEALPILLLILLNGIFSMSEAAIVSSRKARLQMLAERGVKSARTALELAAAPNRFLSTVQIGITLIGVLAGAFGGTTVARELSNSLAPIEALAPFREALSLTIVVVITTYLSLVIGELVPKRLALNAPERVAAAVAGPMHYLSLLAAPVVNILSYSTDGVLRLLRVKPSEEPVVSEDEIKMMMEEGTEVGVFEEAEHDMVKRVFRLNDMRVNMLMTPRTEITWLDIDDSAEEVRRKIEESGFSRYPLCEGSADKVLGIVRAKDLLASQLAGLPLDLKAARRDPQFVPESAPVIDVLEGFKKTGAHMAVVIDEYGGLSGLFTINNILTAIVGEIPQSDKPSDALAVQREDGSWLIDGMLSTVEFKDLFDIAALPEESSGSYQTLAGFVMMSLGKVPASADHFEWNNLRFEVVDMDGNRIDKVLVAPIVAAAEGATEEKGE